MASSKITKTCEVCGTQFLFQPRKKSAGRFCSWECRDYRSPEQIAAHFWSKVDKSGDCWLWMEYRQRYGRFNLKRGTVVAAHRFAYELTHGPIPEGLFALHRCDVPACCNPDHLFLGNQQENMDDMMKKGRHRPATNKPDIPHGNSKLSADQVRQIREATGTHTDIAARFRIAQTCVSDIKAFRTYANIT